MMNMRCWRPRFSGQKDKYEVKVTQLKLELGLFGAKVAASNDNMAIQITGTATKKVKVSSTSSNLLPLIHRTLKPRPTHTTSPQRFLISKTPTIVWDARDLSVFHLHIKHGSLRGACDMTFHVLYGEGDSGENKPKMAVVGKVYMSVAVTELLVGEVQRTLPIQLKVHGLYMEATFSVSLSLLKLMSIHDDSPRTFENIVKYLTSLGKKNNWKVDQVEQPSPYESDDSDVFDSDDSSYESTTSSGSSSNTAIQYYAGSRVTNVSERFIGSDTETRLDTVQRSWSMLSWNRGFKGWSFKTSTRKQANLTYHSSHCMKSDEVSTRPYLHDNNCGASSWENREIWSRDGKTKLQTNVFFASFDQRSKQASGESACTALVVFIAHWLHSSQDMLTRAQFDSLITQGSSEWRRLCHSDAYLNLFPDKHFDLETVLEANLRPLVVLPQESYTGFFSPEKFQCLIGAMSFDEIWDEINRNKVVNYEPRIYIVSWNDHFFVLKVEADAYFIIDTLGERLFEGCQQAFILKFDGSSLMHARVEEVEEDPTKGSEEKSLEIVCSGKECCKEFIKRFLAAIPLRQLEKEEENKVNISNPYLHKLLQIDFHSSSLP